VGAPLDIKADCRRDGDGVNSSEGCHSSEVGRGDDGAGEPVISRGESDPILDTCLGEGRFKSAKVSSKGDKPNGLVVVLSPSKYE
jgi:hypothetical protein